jgi:hypothetical protein
MPVGERITARNGSQCTQRIRNGELESQELTSLIRNKRLAIYGLQIKGCLATGNVLVLARSDTKGAFPAPCGVRSRWLGCDKINRIGLCLLVSECSNGNCQSILCQNSCGNIAEKI